MSRRAEHLFSIIGQVDDAFIDEAACPRRLPRPQRQWTKWAALCAACLLLAVGLWRITPPLARCRWERQWSSAPLQRGQQRRRRS